MKIAAGSLALVLAFGAACGSGTKVEVVNDFGVDLTGVSVSFGGLSSSWDVIEPGDAESTRLTIPESGFAVVAYSCNGVEKVDSLVMPGSASTASKVSIFLAEGSTTIRYSH